MKIQRQQLGFLASFKERFVKQNAFETAPTFGASKKEIDNQIQRLEHSQQQATAYFKENFHVSHEKANAKIAQLEEETKEKGQKYAERQKRLKPLQAQKDKVLFEYQKQKSLMGISHDEQKIQNRLNELELQSRPPKQSAQYTIMMAENEKLLDSISKQNLQIIIKDLDPEKQKAVTKLWEDKPSKDRTFERGR